MKLLKSYCHYETMTSTEVAFWYQPVEKVLLDIITHRSSLTATVDGTVS